MTDTLTCARVRVLLEPYADGDLTGSDSGLGAAVRHHLAACPDCRAQHEQAISLPFRLKALSAPSPRPTLVADVMHAVAPSRATYRRAWGLLAPEGLLVAFILWYLSGLDGLTSIASGMLQDLQGLAGWGTGTGPLPAVPGVDVLLLGALIALAGIAAYHVSVLVRLDSMTKHELGGGARRAARE